LILLMHGPTLEIVTSTLCDQTRNEEILENLKVVPGDQTLIRYRSNWLRIVTRMYSSGMGKNYADL